MRRIIDKKIQDAMTKNVITVTRNTSLKDLKAMFEKYDFNVFPVVENQQLIGVVTKLDFLKIFSFDAERLIPDLKSIFAKNAGDIMSRGIISVSPTDSIQDAARLMRDRHVRSVLVTDNSKKKLLGIISRGDVVKLVEIE